VLHLLYSFPEAGCSGPGGSGLSLIVTLGANFSSITGGHVSLYLISSPLVCCAHAQTRPQYDIASWDPRGVGETKPYWNCFKSYDEELPFDDATTIESKGNFTNANRTDPDVIRFLSRKGAVDSSITALGRLCEQRNPGVGKYLGTAAAARDMISLNDAVEGTGKKVYYWGVSYVRLILVVFSMTCLTVI